MGYEKWDRMERRAKFKLEAGGGHGLRTKVWSSLMQVEGMEDMGR